jgi:hypothetical protein
VTDTNIRKAGPYPMDSGEGLRGGTWLRMGFLFCMRVLPVSLLVSGVGRWTYGRMDVWMYGCMDVNRRYEIDE